MVEKLKGEEMYVEKLGVLPYMARCMALFARFVFKDLTRLS